ncbi:pantoate--beta-alanine ligase [Haloglycomyces albus]|uniref:pantoate--beta-alanine ligase n=1 Tax=Haloglycomyces albus TaxID=526067 RepID=UPI00046CDEC1|nr:pantoate--beta-alanine ligase [Haloglycomyces albus]
MTDLECVTDIAALRSRRAELSGRVAVVPTMGALHEGHADLIRAARRTADHVIVTVFVNPLQFGPGEDLDVYPRTLDADLTVAAREGADLVFAPGEAELYPEGRERLTTVRAPEIGDVLEGASRPGFFNGVLTVVAKLFGLTDPDVAVFGEKDFQQLAMVRRMVRDLNFDVEILAVPTVRESDGLALSSRNSYLSAAERQTALAIQRAIGAARESPEPHQVAHGVLAEQDGLEIDYVAVASQDFSVVAARADEPPRVTATGEVGRLSGPARLLIAAHVGSTRLIDNAPVTIGEGNDAANHV